YATAEQQQNRARHHLPTVIDGPRAKLVITSGKTLLTPLSDWHFKLRFQQVITKKRNKRHRYQPRRHERTGNHDRQRINELTCRSLDHQERKISNDIRDRRVENRGCEFRRSKP